MLDIATEPLERYFEGAVKFIDEALEEGGRVFVHCMMGVSRSTTIVLAYLVAKRNMRLVDAHAHTQSCRSIVCPNPGFVAQLGRWEEKHRGENTSGEIPQDEDAAKIWAKMRQKQKNKQCVLL